MSKYLFVYTGGSGMGEEMTPAEQQAEMALWMAWFSGLGEAVVDMGSPLPKSRTVSSDGVTQSGASGLTGVSTISADSIEAAVEMAAGCPVIAAGGAVEVYETHDMQA